jgi:hypothetical protein
MRDRETDSWWAIMSGEAIGGPYEGQRLRETALGEKVRWADWYSRHPDTKVLAVTHLTENSYEGYFDSERTFRGADPEDDRLPPKTPIFAFRIDRQPFAVDLSRLEGGRLLDIETASGNKTQVFLFRRPGADLLESTRAWRIDGDLAIPMDGAREVVEATVVRGEGDVTPLPGFDTYWYSWIPQNRTTKLLE